MSQLRRVLPSTPTLAATLVFATAACSGAPSDDPDAAVATSTATANATATVTSSLTPAAGDAEDLLVALPNGYAYADAPPEVEQDTRRQFEASGASHIIDSLAVRNVEQGSVPVGAVLAVKLNNNATSADWQGILRGIEEAAGTDGQAIEIDGVAATYVEDGQVKLLLHIDDNDVLMVFGQDRAQIEPVLVALASASNG